MNNVNDCYIMKMVSGILQNIESPENITAISKTVQNVFCSCEEKLCGSCDKYDPDGAWALDDGYDCCPGFTGLVDKVIPTLHMKNKEDAT
jgi:hypothetical protein